MLRLSITLLLPLQLVFAGSFYVNLFLPKASAASVEKYLQSNKLDSFLVTAKKNPDQVIVVSEILDSQDTEAAERISINLSKELKSPILYSLNHDSDILLLKFYENGNRMFAYDSSPGYFTGKITPPAFKKEEFNNLVQRFGLQAKTKELESVLTDKKYVFADERHRAFLKLFSFPEFVAGIGYTYLSMDESILPEIQKLGFEVKKVKAR